MIKNRLCMYVLVCMYALCVGQVSAQPAVALERVFADVQLDRPVFLTGVPGRAGAMVIVEQPGRVVLVENDAETGEERSHVILDVTDRVPNYAGPGRDQMGLLGLAFHPDFPRRPEVYLSYTASRPNRSVLSRFVVGEDLAVDPQSEVVLLEERQPFGTDNGGMIAFGPDGLLYMSIGDGGGRGDPFNHAQRLDSLLGKVLRIDVNAVGEGRGLPYQIPHDNPWADIAEARPELYAIGLSNPWRFSFDRTTGDLWLGDVGEANWEEINLIRRGGNYGWRIREGPHDFEGGQGDERPANLIEPIHTYPHTEGKAIVGGYVYRGSVFPELQGYYVYADHVSGKVRALMYEDGEVKQNRLLLTLPHPSSFGEDSAGELWICSFGQQRDDAADDAVYRLVKKEWASDTR